MRLGVIVGIGGICLLACGPAAVGSPAGTASGVRTSGPFASGPRQSTPLPPTAPPPVASQGVVAEAQPRLAPGELCRLPIILQDPPAWAGAFIAYPGGRLIPSAAHYLPPPAASGQPYASYLSRTQVWVPASRAEVAPDGSTFATEEVYEVSPGFKLTRVHVTEVATGRDRVANEGNSVAVLDFEPEGIYLTGVRWGTEGSGGLWRLDPASGSLTKLSSNDMVVRVRNGAAWAMSSAFQNHQVIKEDLATGTRSVWFEDPNRSVSFAGIDSTGAALIAVVNPQVANDGTLLRVPAPGQAEVIHTGTGFGGDFLARIQWSTDPHGTWLTGADGIYLYSGGAVTKVSGAHAVPAGACF